MIEVSVVLPAYNSARFLPAAIDSALAQGRGDVEVILVDDGSTDATPEVARRYGSAIRYLRQDNRGVAAARNHGIQAARGRYLGFLDADDTWLPGKLDRQLAALGNKNAPRACYSAFLVVDTELRPIGVRRSVRQGAAVEDLLLRGNVVGSASTVLFESALIERIGGFDPQLSQCADWEYWVRLALHTDLLYLDEPMATYRQHDANMSRDVGLLERDSVLVLQKGFSMPGLPERLRSARQRAFARNDTVLAGSYFATGRYRDALRCGLRAIARDPRQAGYVLAYPWRRWSRAMKRT